MDWVILVLTLVLVIWSWKNPRYLLPVLIVALSLEISCIWFPRLVLPEKLGAFVGIIDLGRIMVLVVVSYYLTARIKKRNHGWKFAYHRRSVLQNPLFLISALFILAGLLSLVWSVDPLKTMMTAMRLGVLWFMGLAVYNLVLESRERWLVPAAFSITATVVAGIGAYEAVSSRYIWLGEVYQPIGLVNSTFVDPNILARFLIIGILATLAWILTSSSRSGMVLGSLALLLQTGTLLASGSRTGWLIAVLVLLFVLILLPRKAVLYSLTGSLILAGIYFILNLAAVGKVLDLQQGIWAASLQRQYLITAAWEMFVRHPVLGVGSGGFQKYLLTNYYQLVQNGMSLSHTAALTTAAELGVLGLSILSSFLICLCQPLLKWRHLARHAGRFSEVQYTYIWTVFAFLAAMVIFISAQTEGRFFEDPFLWIVLGYLVAAGDLERMG
ncbi:MAG TPA: O-antigen ligase family protein [Desulfitobacteriaceae bacterium]|nr:O-antigen ligase family protein [Desulfitobacteriaceae bacterium]